MYLAINDPQTAHAMHIMEGFISPGWALFWWAAFIPFFLLGVRRLIRITREAPQLKLLLGLAGAFTFVLSALKIPSITGSSSHPTGTGLGTVMFGPLPMSVLGSIVLLFQAVLLAHGGLSTLGANAFSMAVAGPFAGYAVYRCMTKITTNQSWSIFAAAACANLFTYVVTSFQLALAFPSVEGGIAASLIKFGSIFALTQVPLAISEGLLTLLVWNWLKSFDLKDISVLSKINKGAKNV
nr:energy-coupling factor ABC transporter permease [Paenibacillus abyssi]